MKLERYLGESSEIYGLGAKNPTIRKLVSQVSMKLDFNIDETYSFILHLLEDVNAHSVMAKVEKIFNDDMKNFG